MLRRRCSENRSAWRCKTSRSAMIFFPSFGLPTFWYFVLHMEYEAVIGLETHVQLKTKSKMWCGCPNEFGAPPNTNVCPVCLGMPGVLPVANAEALRLTALTGLLLNCTVPSFAKF